MGALGKDIRDLKGLKIGAIGPKTAECWHKLEIIPDLVPDEYRAEAVVECFREKGVDVKIAVDLVTNACDKIIKTAILCSSDSDLQPAVKEAMKRGIEIIYLGFEFNPNKGLSYTTNRTILIRNSEVLSAYKKSIAKLKR